MQEIRVIPKANEVHGISINKSSTMNSTTSSMINWIKASTYQSLLIYAIIITILCLFLMFVVGYQLMFRKRMLEPAHLKLSRE